MTAVHATAVCLDGQGVLIRGPSGAGKSILALALLERWGDGGLLVADDVVRLERMGDSVVAHAPKRFAGLIELRGRGLVRRPLLQHAPIRLVVDLEPDLVRLPEPHVFTTDLLGAAVPRAPVPVALGAGSVHQLLLVREALRAGGADPSVTN